MRMFLSVSGHSSELSIAKHSSRPTLSQLKCVSDTISNWFKNHQPQKTKISTDTNALFIQNSNQMASRLTATTSFPRVLFYSFNIQGNVQAFRLTGLLWWLVSDTLGYRLVFHSFLFLPHFYIIRDLLLNRRTATWNLFVKWAHEGGC